jgi:hypothetical protein
MAVVGDVNIANKVVLTREQPALKASYITVTFAVTDTQPIQLLGQDNNRKRALISSDDLVIIGKRNQLNTGQGSTSVTGFRLNAFLSPLEISNQDELWALPTGVAANVSVLNERWS